MPNAPKIRVTRTIGFLLVQHQEVIAQFPCVTDEGDAINEAFRHCLHYNIAYSSVSVLPVKVTENELKVEG